MLAKGENHINFVAPLPADAHVAELVDRQAGALLGLGFMWICLKLQIAFGTGNAYIPIRAKSVRNYLKYSLLSNAHVAELVDALG